jgi:hypothetical protein
VEYGAFRSDLYNNAGHVSPEDLRYRFYQVSGGAVFDIDGVDGHRFDLDQQVAPRRGGLLYLQVKQAFCMFNGQITVEANSFHGYAFLSAKDSSLTKPEICSSYLLSYQSIREVAV